LGYKQPWLQIAYKQKSQSLSFSPGLGGAVPSKKTLDAVNRLTPLAVSKRQNMSVDGHQMVLQLHDIGSIDA